MFRILRLDCSFRDLRLQILNAWLFFFVALCPGRHAVSQEFIARFRMTLEGEVLNQQIDSWSYLVNHISISRLTYWVLFHIFCRLLTPCYFACVTVTHMNTQITSLPLVITAVISWMAFEAWIVLRDRKKLDLSKDKNTIHEVYLKSMLSVCLALSAKFFFSSFFIFPQDSMVSSLIGVIIMFSGLLLRFWAIQTLGAFFRRAVMTQQKHRLIQEGPYQWLRHPSYTGAWLGILGFAVTLNNIWSVLIAVVVGLYAFQSRIAVEEEVLSQYFGKEYQQFSSKTKKLIPFVW